MNYWLIQPDQTKAVVNDQLRTGEKYVQCILSKTHSPQTTFYNGEKISRVDGDKIIHITDVEAREEVKLKTYNQVQFGYKKLQYQLSRLPDQSFKSYDCFVVKATAGNGYATMNYFDKTNFRLLMIIYPNGGKSIMTEYIFKDSVLFNSQIINALPNSGGMQVLELRNIHLNPIISDTWFNCPYTDVVAIPQQIKTGKFVSTNGDKTSFTRTKNTMDYTDEKGNVDLRCSLTWNITSPDTFGLIREKALKNEDKGKSEQIIVRIISWDENGYVCQWITDKNTDTQDYEMIK